MDEEEATLYRPNALRVNCLGQDPPELQSTCRELVKGMKTPKRRQMELLKKGSEVSSPVPSPHSEVSSTGPCGPAGRWQILTMLDVYGRGKAIMLEHKDLSLIHI